MIHLRILLLLLLLASPAAAQETSSSWVADRVADLQPRPEEKRFDEIGWAQGILPALSLARERQRPVFLFTQDGRINTGRC
jgi:hypothetical protein